MSDSTTTDAQSGTTSPQGEGTATAQAATGAESQPAGGSQEFTQQRFNDLLAREKHALREKYEAKYADYDSLKEKAAQLDALEEAKKTELEKAQDALAKAQAERDAAIAERDAKQAEIDRANAIAKAAAEHGVDAALLARMEGDVEDNARFLAEKGASAQKYPDVRDGGESGPQEMTLDEINSISNPTERIRARAKYIQDHPDE